MSGLIILTTSFFLALTGFSPVVALPTGVTGPTGPVQVAIGPQGGTSTRDLSDKGLTGPVGVIGSLGLVGPLDLPGLLAHLVLTEPTERTALTAPTGKTEPRG